MTQGRLTQNKGEVVFQVGKNKWTAPTVEDLLQIALGNCMQCEDCGFFFYVDQPMGCPKCQLELDRDLLRESDLMNKDLERKIDVLEQEKKHFKSSIAVANSRTHDFHDQVQEQADVIIRRDREIKDLRGTVSLIWERYLTAVGDCKACTKERNTDDSVDAVGLSTKVMWFAVGGLVGTVVSSAVYILF